LANIHLEEYEAYMTTTQEKFQDVNLKGGR